MLAIPKDLFYEILNAISYPNLIQYCQSNKYLQQMCQSAQGQAIIQKKQRVFRIEQIEEYLDYLLTEKEIYIRDLFWFHPRLKSYKSEFEQYRYEGAIRFLRQHPELYSKLLNRCKVSNIQPDPFNQIIDLLKSQNRSIADTIFIEGGWNSEIKNIISNSVIEFLLDHYDLFLGMRLGEYDTLSTKLKIGL